MHHSRVVLYNQKHIAGNTEMTSQVSGEGRTILQHRATQLEPCARLCARFVLAPCCAVR